MGFEWLIYGAITLISAWVSSDQQRSRANRQNDRVRAAAADQAAADAIAAQRETMLAQDAQRREEEAAKNAQQAALNEAPDVMAGSGGTDAERQSRRKAFRNSTTGLPTSEGAGPSTNTTPGYDTGVNIL